eukprot:TRINITY_DN5432_c0_g2_i1.p1 TRINITY_DN5432_c0_g2~~TRINITY_DN5432_c0_g2_i1.p1  ORF type:complete len:236 (-),score=21.80 TRINITY_DN5432_c0_g2_i1:78-785(-)
MSKVLAYALGIFASFCFTFQYIPQAVLNYKRKSVRGFSTTGIIMKHVGASFLLVNSYLQEETLAVICYGLVNVIQHSLFMFQFSIYGSEEKPGSKKYLLWLFFPLVPLLLGLFYPITMTGTNSMKPITQVLSHIPQLVECVKLKTTRGVSLPTQHLNFLGGIAGLYMCFVIPPVATTTYLIYLNSIFQALSIYFLAHYYSEFDWQATLNFGDDTYSEATEYKFGAKVENKKAGPV